MWIFYLISKHTDAQEKMREEIQSIIGDREITLDHLDKLRYCSAVISEALRIYPPAFTIAREMLQDTQVGSFLLPKGTKVDVPVVALNRDDRYWPNATVFDPERWLKVSKFTHVIYQRKLITLRSFLEQVLVCALDVIWLDTWKFLW